jgi:hypothetical protein
MKRTPLKRRTPLKASKKGKNAPKRRGLRKNGKSPVSKIKRQIQAKLRLNAIERDGGCVLMGKTTMECNEVLQAEHLVSRANSASFADMENIVCLCSHHHIFWKPQNQARYWELIRRHIGEERWAKVQAWAKDKSPHPMKRWDWEQALEKLST